MKLKLIRSSFKRLNLPICINYWPNFCAEMTGGIPPLQQPTASRNSIHHHAQSLCLLVSTTWVKLGGKCVFAFFPAARHVQSKAGPISIFVTAFSSKRATCGLHIVQSIISQWLHLAVHNHGHNAKTQRNLIWGITDVFQIVAQLSF